MGFLCGWLSTIRRSEEIQQIQIYLSNNRRISFSFFFLGRISFGICLVCCFDQRRQMIKEIPVNRDIKLNLLIKSLMENFEKISDDFSSYFQNPLISMCLLCTMFRMDMSRQ